MWGKRLSMPHRSRRKDRKEVAKMVPAGKAIRGCVTDFEKERHKERHLWAYENSSERGNR